MGKVRIVTDSTADLSAEQAREYDIAVMPLTITFGDESYEDGVTIDAATFFAKLAATQQRPITSQPTPGLTEQTMRALVRDGATGILSVSISSGLSGTFQTMTQVGREVTAETGVPVEVVDSRQATLGEHFGILAAARAAREGADLAECAAIARDHFARTTVYLVADDLSYLQRGGRIGQAQRVVGTLLNVKPVITVRDGVVTALESPRTRKRAYERIAELVKEKEPIEGLIVGQTSPELGDQLEAAVSQVYSGPIGRMWAGPAIGTHVGPGAAGLSVLRARV